MEMNNRCAAAYRGNLKILKREVTSDNIEEYDGVGSTVLSSAALGGNVEAIELLLKMGAQVNTRNPYNKRTPLHYAASGCYEHGEACHLLIDHHAEVNVMDNYQHTPLQRAIRCQRNDAVRALINRGANITFVKLDYNLGSVPEWIYKFIESRETCRRVAIIMMGLYRFKRCKFEGNNKDVLRIIGKIIWSSRNQDLWRNSE